MGRKYRDQESKSGPDLYELLKVDREADTKEIRKAYFRIALKVHPDKNPTDKDASANFAVLQQAYEILSNSVKRKHYDRTGSLTDDFTSGFWQAYEKYKAVEVTEADIDAYVSKFHGSEQELKDVYDYFNKHEGDITTILGSIIGSSDADVPRFIKMLSSALEEGKLEAKFAPKFHETKEQVMTIAELDTLHESDSNDSGEDDDSEEGEDDDSFIDNTEIENHESSGDSSEDSETEEASVNLKYVVNDAVKARWRKGPNFYPGRVLKVYKESRKYDIKYDDDQVVEKLVPERLIRPRKIQPKSDEKPLKPSETKKKNAKKRRAKSDDDEYGDMDALRQAILKKNADRSSGFEAFADQWTNK